MFNLRCHSQIIPSGGPKNVTFTTGLINALGRGAAITLRASVVAIFYRPETVMGKVAVEMSCLISLGTTRSQNCRGHQVVRVHLADIGGYKYYRDGMKIKVFCLQWSVAVANWLQGPKKYDRQLLRCCLTYIEGKFLGLLDRIITIGSHRLLM